MVDRLAKFEELSEEFQSLIPLDGKKPIESDWPYYCENTRIFDAANFKGRNAGIPCGTANRVIVIDIDDENLFEKACEKNNWDLPDTRLHVTGRELPHYFYQYPTNGGRYGNRSFKKYGFDIRGMGGQVVAPGSIHPDTGRLYEVIKDIPMAPAPQWLLDLALQEDPGKIPQSGTSNGSPVTLESLPISFPIKALIDANIPRGGRSEVIGSVLASLVKAKVSDSDIFQIFDNHKIGEKYQEKGRSKKHWLQDEITRAKKFVTGDQKKKKNLKSPLKNLKVLFSKSMIFAPWTSLKGRKS